MRNVKKSNPALQVKATEQENLDKPKTIFKIPLTKFLIFFLKKKQPKTNHDETESKT